MVIRRPSKKEYIFKEPNLLEVFIVIGLCLVAIVGLWLLTKAWSTPEITTVSLQSLQAAFSLLQIIFLGIIALILEGIREKLHDL